MLWRYSTNLLDTQAARKTFPWNGNSHFGITFDAHFNCTLNVKAQDKELWLVYQNLKTVFAGIHLLRHQKTSPSGPAKENRTLSACLFCYLAVLLASCSQSLPAERFLLVLFGWDFWSLMPVVVTAKVVFQPNKCRAKSCNAGRCPCTVDIYMHMRMNVKSLQESMLRNNNNVLIWTF